MKKNVVLLLAGLVCLTLAGCGNKCMTSEMDKTVATGYSSSSDSLYNAEMAEESMAEMDIDPAAMPEGENQLNSNALENRKLIKTVNLDVETEEYDALLPNIKKKVSQLGGYIENYTTGGVEAQRYANIVARIPSAQLDQFVDEMSQVSNIIYRNESVEDVTLTYVDLQSHRDMLQAEQKRLLELMEQAESMEDIISLESRLTEVRYELESMESQLKTYDNLIDYSTVTISVSEVEKVSPPVVMSTGEKIVTGFGNNVERIIKGIKALGIAFLINLPFLFLFAIIVLIIVAVIKVVLVICRKKAKKPEIPTDKK